MICLGKRKVVSEFVCAVSVAFSLGEDMEKWLDGGAYA